MKLLWMMPRPCSHPAIRTLSLQTRIGLTVERLEFVDARFEELASQDVQTP